MTQPDGPSAEKRDVLNPTDEAARRQAKTFLRTARYGALGTLDPVSGAPSVSRVSLATDVDGALVFLASQLSPHFAAMEADPRASLLIGSVGKGDPLAHPRITVAGRATRQTGDDRLRVRARFLGRHPKAALYADFGDFAFWTLVPDGASLNGGFGKAFALSAVDLASPECPGLSEVAQGAVTHMNEDHAAAVAASATGLLGEPEGAWRLSALDAEGLDLVLGDRIARLWFDAPLPDGAGLRPLLVDLARRARAAGPGD